ncbi:hypothetical protein ACOMHN_041057 [Nucella lapillus]
MVYSTSSKRRITGALILILFLDNTLNAMKLSSGAFRNRRGTSFSENKTARNSVVFPVVTGTTAASVLPPTVKQVNADVMRSPDDAETVRFKDKATVSTFPDKANASYSPAKANVSGSPDKANASFSPDKGNLSVPLDKMDRDKAIPGSLDKVNVEGFTDKANIEYPGTVQAPGLPDTVKAPGLTDTVKAPGLPDTVKAPGLPDTVKAPDLPDTVKAPGLPDTVKAPGLPDTVKAPGLPDTVKAPGLPDTVKPPGLPDTVKAPGLPDTVKAPGLPDTVKAPGLPDTVKAPGLPDKANVSGFQNKADVPGSSDKSNVPGFQNKADAPGSPVTANLSPSLSWQKDTANNATLSPQTSTALLSHSDPTATASTFINSMMDRNLANASFAQVPVLSNPLPFSSPTRTEGTSGFALYNRSTEFKGAANVDYITTSTRSTMTTQASMETQATVMTKEGEQDAVHSMKFRRDTGGLGPFTGLTNPPPENGTQTSSIPPITTPHTILSPRQNTSLVVAPFNSSYIYLNTSFIVNCIVQEGQDIVLPAVNGEIVVNLTEGQYKDQLCCQPMKIKFSLHPPTAVLQPTREGWNCSVPYWEDYPFHFPCDLYPHCVDGRDEAQCDYQTDRCPQGYFGLRDRCYLFIQGERASDVDDAVQKCQVKGGNLISLNDPQEWRLLNHTLLTYQPKAVVYIGLRTTPSTFLPIPSCVSIHINYGHIPAATNSNCHIAFTPEFICEMQAPGSHQLPWKGNHSEQLTVFPPRLSLEAVFSINGSLPFVACPLGHMTYHFLACDVKSACWEQRSSSCLAPMTPLPPSFVCANGLQCVPLQFLCNERKTCLDGSDEEHCPEARLMWPSISYTGPSTIQFQGDKILRVALNQSGDQPFTCPDGHFYCSGTSYCLPLFLRCNGHNECPRGQDEASCNTYTCAGLYRCRASTICLRPQDVCDNFYHCPQSDDELFCHLQCPQGCICYGQAFFCSHPFPVVRFVDVRFLHAKGSGLQPEDVKNNTMLIHLNLADCQLRELMPMPLPNLHSLDLSDNHLTAITQHHLHPLPQLSHLSIAGNPLAAVFTDSPASSASVFHLLSLDLSHVSFSLLDVAVFRIFPSLQALNLTDCGVDAVIDGGFQEMTHLHTLDLRGNPMTYFSANLLEGLDHLDAVFSDNYKLCCPAVLPSGFNLANCRAPSDEIASCDNLLHSDIYRGVLSCLASLAVLGNLLALISRVILQTVSNGFDVFTVMLCMSDFLMGVYLIIIGVADKYYMGTYLWQDVSWKSSMVCQAAGFLCLLSSEVSALLVCLITVDRFLVIHFPFSHIHFHKKSALSVSCLVWGVGVILATIHLLPPTSHWRFYSQNSICIPLLITGSDFLCHDYSFGLFVIFNVVLFLVITVGQLCIYWSVHVQQSSIHSQSTQTNTELRLAQRLFTVASSDFLCWFPIGLLGLLASTGLSISSEVNVAMAVFILPLNSAMNPFLYTINKLLEKRQQEQEKRLKQFLLAQMKKQMIREDIPQPQ